MVIISSLLKLFHLLKILNKYFKFSTSVKFTALLDKVVWVWPDSLLIPKNKNKWHWLRLFLLLTTDKMYDILIYWTYDCLLILCYTFTSRSNTCPACWILCMWTSWITIANYNFSSQLPKQIIKWNWSLTCLHEKH